MSITAALWVVPALTAVLILLIVPTFNRAWQHRYIWGDIAGGLAVASIPFIWTLPCSYITATLLTILHLWLVLLAARLRFGRLEADFLRRSTQLNTVLLFGAICLLMVGHLATQLQLLVVPYEWRAMGLLGIVGLVSLWATGHMLWAWRHYRLPVDVPRSVLRDLPTVSLCIPARNENHALTDCLQAAVASDYPKLEVLVLDDCSQDATSQIIRSFAHDGVRFVQGDVPADGWLGKNQAMATLAAQASGDYLLFMSVDTQLAPQTISHLIAYAKSQDARMVSVLPQNTWRMGASTILGTLQYLWQVILPITRRRQPVSGRSWLIEASSLHTLGGFAAVQRSIVPEAIFARQLAADQQYRFLISSPLLGATNAKKWSSQVETSLRIMYPSMRRQPVLSLLMALTMVSLLMPFALTVAGLITGALLTYWWLTSVVVSLLILTSSGMAFARTNPQTWLLATACLPVALIQELILMLSSMLQYEFGQVNWKGRNVCYPVLGLRQRSFVGRRLHTKPVESQS